jgi:glycosyltransferase involved in cell wall biosynthesis
MKIAFVSTMSISSWGGSEELWSQAALRLRQLGHDVVASVPWPARMSPKIAALRAGGVRVTTREPIPGPLSKRIRREVSRRLGATGREVAWLRKENPDFTVISQGGIHDGVDWMGACTSANAQFALIVQCNFEAWWPDDALANRLEQGYRRARKVFCVSNGNRELLQDQLGEQLPNCTVVWNPINIVAGAPPDWPGSDQTWRLACVARLDPRAKGQDLLIRVLSSQRWRERPVELSFYGSGEWEGRLRKLTERMGAPRIFFRGQTGDIRRVWAANHLLVLPSRYEGLPLVLIEAMYCARPAVVTDVGGNAEMCVDGETGFVAAAPTVGLVEDALERAWMSRAEWQRMGSAARARVERLVPADPVGAFCDQLLECLPASR